MISLLGLIVFGYTHRVSSFIGYTYSYRLARNQLALSTHLLLYIFKRENIEDKPIRITNFTNPRVLAFEYKLLITSATLFSSFQIATKYCFVHIVKRCYCIACRRHFKISLALRSRKFYKTKLWCSVQTPAFYTQ